MQHQFRAPALALLFVAAIWATPGRGAAAEVERSRGQTVYVPIYSHIYGGDLERAFQLAATCSIRNIDPDRSITLEAVDYYDSDGKRVERYLESPQALGPLASVRYVIPESDARGGSGAKFLVRWRSDAPIRAPLIEGIMIGTRMHQGISFVSRGQVIEERGE